MYQMSWFTDKIDGNFQNDSQQSCFQRRCDSSFASLQFDFPQHPLLSPLKGMKHVSYGARMECYIHREAANVPSATGDEDYHIHVSKDSSGISLVYWEDSKL